MGLLSFTLPGGIPVNIVTAVAPLAPLRPFLAAFIGISLLVSLVGLLMRFLGMGGGVRAVISQASESGDSE